MKTKTTIKIISFLAIIAVTACLSFGATKPEDEAQKSAEQWLALIDAGKYADSWETAADYFKKAISKEKWESALASVRQPLGNLVSRKLKSAKYSKSLPGAPDGEYVVLQFDTSFTNKKEAVETITPMLDKDGTWKVSGYFIK
jgi:hypothetical protein